MFGVTDISGVGTKTKNPTQKNPVTLQIFLIGSNMIYKSDY